MGDCFGIAFQVYRIQGCHDRTAVRRTATGASIAMRMPEAFATELLGDKQLRGRKLLDGDRAMRGDSDNPYRAARLAESQKVSRCGIVGG